MHTRVLHAQAVTHGSSDFVAGIILRHCVDLGRDTLGVAIVLDGHRDSILVFSIQVGSSIERQILSIVFLLQGLDKTLVEDRLHGAANSVVTPNAVFVVASNVANQEVSSDEAIVVVVLFPVMDFLLVNRLKDNVPRGAVDIRAGVLNNVGLNPRDWCLFWLVHSDCEVGNDSLCVGGVEVSLGWGASHVSLEAVTSVEELANVTSDVLLENKAATRVVNGVFLNVKDKVVQDDKLAALLDFTLEFSSGHSRVEANFLHVLAQLHLMVGLTSDESDEEESGGSASQTPAKRLFVFKRVEVNKAGPDHELRSQD